MTGCGSSRCRPDASRTICNAPSRGAGAIVVADPLPKAVGLQTAPIPGGNSSGGYNALTIKLDHSVGADQKQTRHDPSFP